MEPDNPLEVMVSAAWLAEQTGLSEGQVHAACAARRNNYPETALHSIRGNHGSRAPGYWQGNVPSGQSELTYLVICWTQYKLSEMARAHRMYAGQILPVLRDPRSGVPRREVESFQISYDRWQQDFERLMRGIVEE